MDTRLEYNLKQLRLATFIQSYQEQAEEAIKNQLSYIQYLAILTELEVIKRSNALIQRRLKGEFCYQCKKYYFLRAVRNRQDTSCPSLRKRIVLKKISCLFQKCFSFY
jgi:hypothetical protein